MPTSSRSRTGQAGLFGGCLLPGDRPNINHGAFHLGLDTGKRSIVVDTTTASGEAILGALAALSDVLIMHLLTERAQTVLALLDGLGEASPSVVAMSLMASTARTSAGSRTTSPCSRCPTGWGAIHSMTRSRFATAPKWRPLQWASTATAVTAAAIWGREHDGKRRMVEVAGVEALAANVDSWFVQWSFTGASTPRPAGPSKAAYPTGYLPCQDGYVSFFAGTPPFFGRLCRAIGHPEFADDPRFTDPAQKPKHFDEFMGHLQPYLDSRTREQVFTELQSHGVMVAPLLDVSEALRDPQAVAQGSYVEFEQPGMGTHVLPGAPFRLARTWRLRPAPDLGQHTEELLSELRYTRAEQVALFRAGVTM